MLDCTDICMKMCNNVHNLSKCVFEIAVSFLSEHYMKT